MPQNIARVKISLTIVDQTDNSHHGEDSERGNTQPPVDLRGSHHANHAEDDDDCVFVQIVNISCKLFKHPPESRRARKLVTDVK